MWHGSIHVLDTTLILDTSSSAVGVLNLPLRSPPLIISTGLKDMSS